MESTRPARWDLLAVAVAVVTVLVAVLYLVVMSGQDNDPALWFLGGLAVAFALGIYGAVRTAPGRGAALVAAGLVLLAFGLLGIFSIGLPLLGAGVVALVAAARTHWRPAPANPD